MTKSVDIELLKPDAKVRMPGRAEVVKLIAVTPGAFWEFYFDGPSGPGKHVLSESELVVCLRFSHARQHHIEISLTPRLTGR